MAQNIIELARELSIRKLFHVNGFSTSWPTWKKTINNELFSFKIPTEKQIYDLGDHLSDIFLTTGTGERSQGEVSVGGSDWESFVCWYLNLCLIGRRTIVIKHNKDLIPSAISDAITVNYGSFKSNTESDLIAITFPEKKDYSLDKDSINIKDDVGDTIQTYSRRKYRFLPIINTLVARDFEEIEIHIIQCKTNWNDNAQIPMLWDAIYSAEKFRNGISVGTSGRSIHNIKRFTYSFVTVPTNKLEKNGIEKYKTTSTPVLRVSHLSGGNYWGHPSKAGVACSIKEILDKNLNTGHSKSILSSIRDYIPEINSTYSYFDLL